MAVFSFHIQDPKQYLHLISGLTRLTPMESDVLGEIISYMQEKRLRVLDDRVRDHIIQKFNYKRAQLYYNMISSLKKKKMILHSHSRMEINTKLLPGSVIQIHLQEPVTALETFTDNTFSSNGKETTGDHQ